MWLFFEEAVTAALARKLGSFVLTETMERRPEAGFDSYDRFFPNQDTLPQGGFGNLIALPLQKQARDRGNSIFLDDAWMPHRDQWAFLSSVRRISRAQVEAVVHEASATGRIVGVRLPADEEESEPWTEPPSRRRKQLAIPGVPKSLEMVLGSEIYIEKEALVPALRNRLLRLAAFQNPEFYRAQVMRLPVYDKPRIVACAEDHPRHIGLPRGCFTELMELLSELNVTPVVRDERASGVPLQATFRGELRREQQIAANAMLGHDTGVLAATTAFGKTVIAAWLIAQRGVNALVLVHRRQLLDQWLERLSSFLDLPKGAIGQIGGGRDRATGLLDIALIQSLGRKGVVDDRVGEYGHLIVDECHHLPAYSFEQVARRARARFVAGLSATVARKDGHHPIVFMQCGPVRHRVNAKAQAIARPFEHTVIVRPTSLQSASTADADQRMAFQALYRELIDNEVRNTRICDDVVEAVRAGRSPLVLTERNDHLDRLASRLSGRVQHLIVLRGGMGRKQRSAVAERLAAIPPHEERVLLSTGKYIGEGFDDARLDTLMLTLPVSWRGTIAQYAGRLHRLHDDKREVRIYDYADLDVPMLARMFDRRCRGYEAVGYAIVLPASAVPGWPADVPLPADPAWKHDYAASVRRLIRDGVDAPLANLFVHASRFIAGRRGSGSRAQRVRGVSVSAAGDAVRDPQLFRAEREAADCVRCAGRNGSGPVVRGEPAGDRNRRRTAPLGCRGLAARPAQGQAAAGEWLLGAALSRGGCWKGSRFGSRCDSAGVVSTEDDVMTRISEARFAEMVEEATVDCYNDSEKITGWFTTIDDNLAVPFEATVLGLPVVVERVDLAADDRIVALCVRGSHRQTIPLVDLPRPASLPHGWEWVEAYQLWDRKTSTSQF